MSSYRTIPIPNFLINNLEELDSVLAFLPDQYKESLKEIKPLAIK